MIKPDGGPMFPELANQVTDGITLRQWYAGMALYDLTHTNRKTGSYLETAEEVAKLAFELADAMIVRAEKERESHA